MAKILAVTNQKGGVGKTTTAMNLGVGLGMKGKRVLFVDMDPQCSLTYIMNGNSAGVTVRELLFRQAAASQAIQEVPEGHLIPASPGLSSMDANLTQPDMVVRLREALAPVADRYDYIVIDSPPTLGVLTVNILAAANGVIIPALADIFSVQGTGQLYATIRTVKGYCNPNLSIWGILLVRHTERFILNRGMRQMLEDTAQKMGTQVYRTTVREAVTLREAEASRESIFKYSPKCKQAKDYMAFVEEFLRQQGE